MSSLIKTGDLVNVIPHDPFFWEAVKNPKMFWFRKGVQAQAHVDFPYSKLPPHPTHQVLMVSPNVFIEATPPVCRFGDLSEFRGQHLRVWRYYKHDFFDSAQAEWLIADLARQYEGKKYDYWGLLPFAIETIAKIPHPFEIVGRVFKIPGFTKFMFKALNRDDEWFCSEASSSILVRIHKEIPEFPRPYALPNGDNLYIERVTPAHCENWPREFTLALEKEKW